MALEREMEVYQRDRAQWVAAGNAGKWVVICGEDVAGFYDTLEDAMTAAYDRYGVDVVFMAREVVEKDQPIFASRAVRPCRR